MAPAEKNGENVTSTPYRRRRGAHCSIRYRCPGARPVGYGTSAKTLVTPDLASAGSIRVDWYRCGGRLGENVTIQLVVSPHA